jgi:hypothetical protein
MFRQIERLDAGKHLPGDGVEIGEGKFVGEEFRERARRFALLQEDEFRQRLLFECVLLRAPLYHCRKIINRFIIGELVSWSESQYRNLAPESSGDDARRGLVLLRDPGERTWHPRATLFQLERNGRLEGFLSTEGSLARDDPIYVITLGLLANHLTRPKNEPYAEDGEPGHR